METVKCGYNKDWSVVLDGSYAYFGYKRTTIVTLNLLDYEEVFEIMQDMRKTYRVGALKYRANVFLSYIYFSPDRNQSDALKTNTLYIHYACEQNPYYAGTIQIMDRYQCAAPYADNGAGDPTKVFKFSSTGEEKLREAIKNYLSRKEKVRCTIGDQEFYLSKESVEELKKLGRN